MSFQTPVARQEISEAAKKSPQTVVALANVLGQFKPLITSVIGMGHHATNSAHYHGNAVDVGAFGDTPVGWNAPTLQAIVAAIGSGAYRKIGTIPQIANDPRLKAFAALHNVTLFEDIGTGPHAHFEVW